MTDQKLCQACGKPNREQARFCGYCGKSFHKEKDLTTATSPALHTSTSHTARAPTPQDFGITPADVAHIEAQEAWVEALWPKVKNATTIGAAIFWLSYGLLKFGWTTLFPKGLLSFQGLVTGGLLSFILFLLALFTSFVVSPLVRALMSLIIRPPANAKAVCRYKEALREFQEWWLRTQRHHQAALEAERRRQREIAWKKKLRDKSYLQQVDPREFERIVLFLYENMGYSTEATPITGDQGIDGFLRRDGKLVLLQCKRVKSGVGQPVIRDLYGNIAHFLGEKKSHGISVSGLLVTTGSVSQQAKAWARNKPIKVVELDELVSLIEKHIGIDNIVPKKFNPANLPTPKGVCPKCGSRLRKINGRNGPFYGCTSYPTCRYTRSRLH